MKIDIKKMKKDYNLLKILIRKYEENVLNYYGKMNYVFSEWNDKNGLKFYEHISDEKKNVFLLIDNLKAICNLYEYLIKNYEQFGKTLSFDLSRMNDINEGFDKLSDKFDIIIKKYDNLNLDLDIDKKEQIISQKEKVISMKKKLTILKKNSFNTLDTIEKIEKEINNRLFKISIKNISETNISEYV